MHDWYRFVLSFPSHLVREYLATMDVHPNQCVLDPFCGTGTTLVECKKLGVRSVGIERNPIAWFASDTKLNWDVAPDTLLEHATEIADEVCRTLEAQGLDDMGNAPLFRGRGRPLDELATLHPDQQRLLVKHSISALPLHKTLLLLDTIESRRAEKLYGHERLALAAALVSGISNLHFGPEVGVRRIQPDSPVVSVWRRRIQTMAEDLVAARTWPSPASAVHLADSRGMADVVEDTSIDAVITSPPYPNEKDYTRTTRLENVLLGFVQNREELQNLKRGLVRSNTRGVYVTDEDDQLVENHAGIQAIAGEIEKRRIAQGKTSGFERQYARVAKLYFGGMVRHLDSLRTKLRPGARLAYIVGDQASYLRVMIRTGKILGELAQSLGYELTAIDLFRTRYATASRQHLREEVVRLRWPG